MINRRRDNESVEALIGPWNSLSDRSDEEKRMHVRGAERINSGDERWIVPVEINWNRHRPTADIEDRPAQIGKAKRPKDHRPRVVVYAQAVAGICLIGSLAGF